MKHLEVPFTEMLDRTSSIQHVADLMNRLEKNPIEMVPWEAYDYQPKVAFSITHSNDCLFLKFYVSESTVRIRYSNTHDPVYKDSCVEFFVAFNGEKGYYNFEFNCLGTCLASYDEGRKNRTRLPEAAVANIKYLAELKSTNTQKEVHWELTLMMLTEVFCNHELTQLKGMRCKANFYKCGDELPQPHYLSWSDIKADKPNFHLPEFFGEINFV